MNLIKFIMDNCKFFYNPPDEVKKIDKDAIKVVVNPVAKGVTSGVWEIADYHAKDK